MDDILNNLEALGSGDERPAPETGRTDSDAGMYSALAAMPDPETRERVLRMALDHQVDRRDPAWLLVETAVVSITAASETGAAARLVHEDVTKIPELIHHAVLAGGKDISGQVQSAVLANVNDLAQAIQGGIVKSTGPAVLAVQNALKDFDSKIDKAIIARKDAVLAQWVQSGSDALDQKVREAIKTERSINLVIMLFVIFATFLLGITLGMHLHF